MTRAKRAKGGEGAAGLLSAAQGGCASPPARRWNATTFLSASSGRTDWEGEARDMAAVTEATDASPLPP